MDGAGEMAPTPGELFDPAFTLPISVGLAALLGGGLLVLPGGPGRDGLVGLFYTGLALLLVAGVLYVLFGLWLLPASLGTGGALLLAAHQVYFAVPGPWTDPIGGAFLVLGGAGLLGALFRRRTGFVGRRSIPAPRADEDPAR